MIVGQARVDTAEAHCEGVSLLLSVEISRRRNFDCELEEFLKLKFMFIVFECIGIC